MMRRHASRLWRQLTPFGWTLVLGAGSLILLLTGALR